MNYLIKASNHSSGLTFLVRGAEQGLKHIDFGLLHLSAGAEARHQFDGKEAGLIILRGRCTLHCGGETHRGLGEREHVFAGRAAAAYIPPGQAFTLTAETDAEIAVALAPSDRPDAAVRVVRPEEVKVNRRGRANWEREVHDIIDERIEAACLVIGETYNPSGNWSSYPPHKHECEVPGLESQHEEVYYFKMNPAQGFALMRLYQDEGRDQAIVVEDGDTVLLPNGYHPVVAAPGYQAYYLWVLAGEKRTLLMHDDPKHAWVKKP
jgi:5-deoxy-glucuronate isomerase